MDTKHGQRLMRLADVYKAMIASEQAIMDGVEAPQTEEKAEVLEEDAEQVDELFGYGIGSSRKRNMEGLNPFNANIVAAHLSRHRQIHYLGKELAKHMESAIGKVYRVDPKKTGMTPEQLGQIMAVIIRTM